MANTKEKQVNGEIALRQGLTDEEVRNLTPEGLQELFSQGTYWDEVEPSFNVLEKESLLNVPFAILSIRSNVGSYGKFVSLTIRTNNNIVGVINDGSEKSGIAHQINEALVQGFSLPFIVKGGLRKSVYESEGGPATTYYLSSALKSK